MEVKFEIHCVNDVKSIRKQINNQTPLSLENLNAI
jgi:hypothetical protein